jgi:hypothetical protein
METKPLILQEDGHYFIEVNINGDPKTTNGFLMRRCVVSLTSPEGAECVGGYDRDVTGKWNASVTCAYDSENDSDVENLGSYGTRDEAVDALWVARWRAYARHPRF